MKRKATVRLADKKITLKKYDDVYKVAVTNRVGHSVGRLRISDDLPRTFVVEWLARIIRKFTIAPDSEFTAPMLRGVAKRLLEDLEQCQPKS